MKTIAAIIATLSALTPVSAAALSLEFPAGAVQTGKVAQDFGSIAVPVGVYADGAVPVVLAEGTVLAQAWKISSAEMSTLQIMAPLRQQLAEEGFEIILDCETDQCGGFDFRYEINLLPEPEMHVDLGDFRYISARKETPDGSAEYIGLTVSRGGSSGFVQVTRIGSPDTAQPVVVASSKSAIPDLTIPPMPTGSLAALLTNIGRAPLEDLRFPTGSSELGEDKFGSLAELAAYLKTNPDKTVALVGHTDAKGSLAQNLALSEKRASAVLHRLASVYGVPKGQMEAAGVGYLVPLASNLTEGGRIQNRRVEVILTSTVE